MRIKNKIFTYEEKPIYGLYHCFNCNTEMKPLKTIPYTAFFGIRHLHWCPKCGELLIESEEGETITKIRGDISYLDKNK